MANEIRNTSSLTATRSTSNVAMASVVGFCDVYATLLDGDIGTATQTFDTTGAAISLAGVTSPGYVYVKHTGAAGLLHLYTDSGFTQRFCSLSPGEGITIPKPASTWGKASASTIQAQITAAKTA